MPFALSNTTVASEKAMQAHFGFREGNPVLPEAGRQEGTNEQSHFKCLSFFFENIPWPLNSPPQAGGEFNGCWRAPIQAPDRWLGTGQRTGEMGDWGLGGQDPWPAAHTPLRGHMHWSRALDFLSKDFMQSFTQSHNEIHWVKNWAA